MSSTPAIARQRFAMCRSIHRSASASSGGFCAMCRAFELMAGPEALYAGTRGAVRFANAPRSQGGASAE
jgi:hypothetical protein